MRSDCPASIPTEQYQAQPKITLTNGLILKEMNSHKASLLN